MSVESVYVLMVFRRTLARADRLVEVLGDLADRGFALTGISDVGPPYQPYSVEAVTKMLREPVLPELPCRTMDGVGPKLSIGVRACVPGAASPSTNNVVDLAVKRPSAARMNDVRALFEGDFFERHQVAYAMADEWERYLGFRWEGTLVDSLPGVWWLNWLSRPYLDQLGDALMDRLPWHRVDRRPAGTLYRLHERLDDPGVDRTDGAKAILHGIGIDRFTRGLWPDIPRIGTLD